MIKFHDLPETEQKEFISRLMHAIAHNNTAFAAAQAIVSYCDDIGAFDKVKIGTAEVVEDFKQRERSGEKF